MKKLWLSTLTAVTLMTGMSFGTAAWAGDHHHGHHRDHDRWEQRDRGYRDRGWDDRRHYYGRPYREIREVYYAPAPRYYGPAYSERVYYGAPRRYDSGVRGTISVDF